ncbi:hypothetical protein [Brevundimonas sp.]|uniref:hypothetical protein n=1 Tax=Brevundimonas sp. TaxID=1871086 RepID=UPI003F728A62
MDKFDRRPNARQTRQKILLAVFAFCIPAIWFGSLFAFGNAAGPWAILGYVILFGGFGVVQARAYMRRLKLWQGTIKRQPEDQEPRYSPLERMTLDRLLQGSTWELGGALVRERYNSGRGCVVTLDGPKIGLPPATFERLVCLSVEGLDAPVGARLWPDEDGRAAMLEFFTTADTRTFDWSRPAFELIPVPAGLVQPSMAPVVSEASWKHFRYEG